VAPVVGEIDELRADVGEETPLGADAEPVGGTDN
jgi:hypothetical protein